MAKQLQTNTRIGECCKAFLVQVYLVFMQVLARFIISEIYLFYKGREIPSADPLAPFVCGARAPSQNNKVYNPFDNNFKRKKDKTTNKKEIEGQTKEVPSFD